MGVAAVGARGGWRGGRVRSGVCRALASSASRKKTAGGVRPAGRRRRLAVGCSIRSTCSLPVRLLPLTISLLPRTETKSDSTSVASLREGLLGLDPLEDGREDHLRGRPTSGPYCTVGLYFTPPNPGRVGVSRPITPDHALITPLLGA